MEGVDGAVGSEQPLLDGLHQGCLMLGFLAYKVPLIITIADANVPKASCGAWSRPRWLDCVADSRYQPASFTDEQLVMERVQWVW